MAKVQKFQILLCGLDKWEGDFSLKICGVAPKLLFIFYVQIMHFLNFGLQTYYKRKQ